MISKEEAIAQFKQILSGKTGWAKLASSQFVAFVCIFVSWCLRDALWKLERLIQEFFLSTALNKSSILAHVEDREYLPRKRIASTGKAAFANSGTSTVSLPAGSTCQSEAALTYSTLAAATIPAAGTVSVDVSQHEQKVLTFPITQEKVFAECLFSKEDTDRICKFTVRVDSGAGFEPWSYARLFQNCYPDSKVYDEFFAHNGQSGIRFGNGIFGAVLPLNSVVEVTLWLTEGPSNLLVGKPLFPLGDIYDNELQIARLSAVVTEVVDGGEVAEVLEEIRTNLHYWSSYNDKLIWNEDYLFFIKKRHPNVRWIKVWGEQEQEEAYGINLSYINKIFISAYDPSNVNIGTAVIAELSALNIYNRKFEWVAPLLSLFTVTVTGQYNPLAVGATVQSDIRASLEKNYAASSTTRLTSVFIKDLYRIINDTGYFTHRDATFSVAVAGVVTPTRLNEMVCIDMNNVTLTLVSA